ncbi:MAG: hypothetical protein ACRD0G_20915 [Acidimicrobiales bacterium]
MYRIAGAPHTWKQRATAAQLATGGVVSHATAAALHGLLKPSPLPHVTVLLEASARCRIAKEHRAALNAMDCTTIEGIRTATVSRVLVDLASVLDRPAVEELVDVALCQRVASPESTLRSLERVGVHRPGRVLLRSVLEVWTEAIEPGSPAEVRLLRHCDEWGLVSPITQHEVWVGAEFVGRVDVGWPDQLVALEYEGRDHHPTTSPASGGRRGPVRAASRSGLAPRAGDQARPPAGRRPAP